MTKHPQFIQLHQADNLALAAEAAAGLLAGDASASPKFFYDALGSRLFDVITELPEYYPTRTEAAILAQHGPALAAAALAATGSAPVLVDLGAGNCAKGAALFGPVAPRRYVALDISVDYLRSALADLQRRHPAVDLVGVGQDFSQQLQLPDGLVDGPALVFYPGSSIGNFDPDAALRLLRQARALAGGGALLIGVDQVKPVALRASRCISMRDSAVLNSATWRQSRGWKSLPSRRFRWVSRFRLNAAVTPRASS